MALQYITLCLLVLIAYCLGHGDIGCVNEKGESVDMFVIYKLPRLHSSPHPLVKSGVAYAYLDASTNYKFVLSTLSIASNESAAGRTLAPVYEHEKEKGSDLAHIFYNDAPPNGSYSWDCGHTKGSLAFNSTTGFWMIHSVPHYPPVSEDSYDYPHSGTYFGQLYMCMNFEASQFEKIGYNIRVDNSRVFSSSIPEQMASNFPNIVQLIAGDMISESPFYTITDLQSIGGVAYRHFAKANKFHNDLYHDLVAKQLETPMLAETWQYDKVIGPSCSNYTVEDATNITLTMVNDEAIVFTTLDDHSKFVVSKVADEPYVCIGDINREFSQFYRGGGTMCVKNPALWETFRGAVTKYNAC